VSAPLAGVRAVVFDAFGTLLDVHSALAGCGGELGAAAGPVSRLWRSKQLEYSWLRALMGHHADFWQVTGEALDYALASHGLAATPLRDRLMAGYRRLAAFPEVPDMLGRLRATGLPLAILSNGTPAMLAAALTHAGLDGQFAAVCSIEAAGVYKPHPAVYQLAVDRLGVAAADLAFLSANGWDAHGAAAFGCRAVWVNRADAPAERLPGALAASLPDLAGLPALLGA
jgi:2-haloacid dehalogenase